MCYFTSRDDAVCNFYRWQTITGEPIRLITKVCRSRLPSFELPHIWPSHLKQQTTSATRTFGIFQWPMVNHLDVTALSNKRYVTTLCDIETKRSSRRNLKIHRILLQGYRRCLTTQPFPLAFLLVPIVIQRHDPWFIRKLEGNLSPDKWFNCKLNNSVFCCLTMQHFLLVHFYRML